MGGIAAEPAARGVEGDALTSVQPQARLVRTSGLGGPLGAALRSSPPFGRLHSGTGLAFRFPARKRQSLLVVYVDDFKMAGPSGSLPKAWQLIRSGIDAEKAEKLGSNYRGCEHKFSEVLVGSGQSPLEALSAPAPPSGGPPSQGLTKVRPLMCNVSGFLQQCVDRFVELTGKPRTSLCRVTTPLVDKDKGDASEQAEVRGELGHLAAKMPVKTLYAARVCR